MMESVNQAEPGAPDAVQSDGAALAARPLDEPGEAAREEVARNGAALRAVRPGRDVEPAFVFRA